MDPQLGRDILAQLKALVKAQTRTALALEAANAADPLAMIQEALGGAGDDTAAPSDDGGVIRFPPGQYEVTEPMVIPGRGADLPESERWRLGGG